MTPKPDPLLGLHFGNVLGDALCAERGLARRLSWSREGPRDIVFVSNWFMCCEHLPEMPSIQGWVEAMTSLGRLIFFDQPGCGVSDPVTPGALPTLEQWADSITAVLDDLGSREAVLVAAEAFLSRPRCLNTIGLGEPGLVYDTIAARTQFDGPIPLTQVIETA